jgi:PLP dependent protein
MAIATETYHKIVAALKQNDVQLIAVSKIKSIEDILALHQLGQLDFGENYVQELVEKQAALQHININWHFIGHLQSNKVKYIAPFVHLIQGVDSFKLLKEINKQAFNNNRVIDCLLQIFIANEPTKFGLDANEVEEIFNEVEKGNLPNVNIKGFMGMASFVDDEEQVRNEFKALVKLANNYTIPHKILSFGMSGDYQLAIEEGSNMIRIGSLLFGARN